MTVRACATVHQVTSGNTLSSVTRGAFFWSLLVEKHLLAIHFTRVLVTRSAAHILMSTF